jgi:hypothetical protein
MRTLLALLLLATTLPARALDLQARLDIADAVTSLLHGVDALDWTRVRGALAAEVRLDYTSLFGGSATSLPADQLVANWRALLPGFDATQHLIGPILVRGGDARAEVEATVRGYHRIKDAAGGDIWMVAGRYDMQLAPDAGQWRIAAITLVTYYQEGNLALPALAQQRAMSTPRRAQ